MVVTRSGLSTSNNPIEPYDSGPSGTGNVDPFATAPPSPQSPGSIQPSSMEAVLRTMMEMMLKQDEIRMAAEKEREARRLALEEERLAADREERVRMHDLLSSMMVIRSDPSSSNIDYDRLASTIAAASVKASHDSHAPITEKLQFSKYDGKMDATTIYSWLHQFNSYFATTKKTDNSKVLTAAMYLAGDAINWYHAWQEKQAKAYAEAHSEAYRNANPLTYSWEEFQSGLQSRFMPRSTLPGLRRIGIL